MHSALFPRKNVPAKKFVEREIQAETIHDREMKVRLSNLNSPASVLSTLCVSCQIDVLKWKSRCRSWFKSAIAKSIISQPLLYFEDITSEGTLTFQWSAPWEQVKTNHEVNHEIKNLMSSGPKVSKSLDTFYIFKGLGNGLQNGKRRHDSDANSGGAGKQETNRQEFLLQANRV